jgi:hypothetical protein
VDACNIREVDQGIDPLFLVEPAFRDGSLEVFGGGPPASGGVVTTHPQEATYRGFGGLCAEVLGEPQAGILAKPLADLRKVGVIGGDGAREVDLHCPQV